MERIVLLFLSCWALLALSSATIIFDRASSTGSRAKSGSNTQYSFNITVNTDLSNSISCTVALSSDSTAQISDYFLNNDDNRCLGGANCPEYFNWNPSPTTAGTRSASITMTDSRSGMSDIKITAIVTCASLNKYFCSFFNSPTAPTCLLGDNSTTFNFAANSLVAVRPPTRVSIGLPATTSQGSSVTGTASADGDTPSYDWTITGMSALQGPSIQIVFNAVGTYNVSVNVSNEGGWVSASQQITVTPLDDNGGSTGGNTNNGNGGAIAAAVIIPIIVIAALILAAVWYVREKRKEGNDPLAFFKPGAKKGLSVTELNHTTDVAKTEQGISSPVGAGKTTMRPYFAPVAADNAAEDEAVAPADAEYEAPMPVVPIPVFEGDLEALATQINEAPVLPIVWSCCEYIESKGLSTEGIFRIPGSLTEMKELKAGFDRGQPVDLNEKVKDPLTVAGLLKLHFRDGREENVPKRSYAALYSARHNPEDMKSVLLCEFTPLQIATVRRICYTFTQVCAHSEENLMHPDNLAKVFGPSLFKDMSFGNANTILACWIKNYDVLFNF